MRNIWKILTVAALILIPMTMSACNTMKGAGEDTKDAGQGIKNAAS